MHPMYANIAEISARLDGFMCKRDRHVESLASYERNCGASYFASHREWKICPLGSRLAISSHTRTGLMKNTHSIVIALYCAPPLPRANQTVSNSRQFSSPKVDDNTFFFSIEHFQKVRICRPYIGSGRGRRDNASIRSLSPLIVDAAPSGRSDLQPVDSSSYATCQLDSIAGEGTVLRKRKKEMDIARCENHAVV